MSNKQEIIDLLNFNEPSFRLFEEKIRNKNVILLLGLARSGKSTLGNYLIGNQLRSIQGRRRLLFNIIFDDAQVPWIGHNNVTGTPGYFELSEDTVIIEAARFDDNRSIARDILNSIFASHIKLAKTIKFIIVSDSAAITRTYNNISPFLTTLKELHRFVINLTEKINSFAVVFTKDYNEFTQAEFAELLAQRILNDHELLHVNRELVANFVDNHQLIGIFRMPTMPGVITSDDGLTINVDGAIDSCVAAAADDCEIEVALSDLAKYILFEIITEYTDTTLFEPQLKKIILKLGYTTSTKSDIIIVKLDKELTRNFSFLHEILDSLSHILYPEAVDVQFQRKFRLIILLDKLAIVEHLKEVIIRNYKYAITELKSEINRLNERIVRKVASDCLIL